MSFLALVLCDYFFFVGANTVLPGGGGEDREIGFEPFFCVAVPYFSVLENLYAVGAIFIFVLLFFRIGDTNFCFLMLKFFICFLT